MNKLKRDMVGKKFGRLTVIQEIAERNKRGHIMYLCQCECGATKEILGASLREGRTRSCKCLQAELHSTHGMWQTREFKIWQSLFQRCYNEGDSNYYKYGARGIEVCDRWKDSFENFYADMGNSNGLSIDRKDVNGNYTPDNCRWATPTEQARNRTNNNWIEYNGETKCFAEWCKIFKLPTSTLNNRIQRGWSIAKALETPVKVLHRRNGN